MAVPLEYLLSPFSIVVNGAALLAVISGIQYRLKTLLPLCSGKHYVEGVITHSEYGMFAASMDLKPEAIVTCSFQIDGKQYNKNVPRWGFSEHATAMANPKGKKVTVYYSPVEPRIIAVDILPRKIDIVASTIIGSIVGYMFFVYIVHSIYVRLGL